MPTRSLHRPGMSVVEVMVALMLVTVGLLAIAGSSAIALRASLDTSRRRHVAARMATRLAQLEAAGCANAAAGTAADTAIQLTERWTVVRRGSAFVVVRDSVSWMGARGRVARSLAWSFPC